MVTSQQQVKFRNSWHCRKSNKIRKTYDDTTDKYNPVYPKSIEEI